MKSTHFSVLVALLFVACGEGLPGHDDPRLYDAGISICQGTVFACGFRNADHCGLGCTTGRGCVSSDKSVCERNTYLGKDYCLDSSNGCSWARDECLLHGDRDGCQQRSGDACTGLGDPGALECQVEDRCEGTPPDCASLMDRASCHSNIGCWWGPA